MCLKEVRRWEARLAWLESILDPRPLTTHLASTKVEQFAAEAYRLEAGDILDVLDEAKRHTLLLCLLHYVQVVTRDQLTTMFLKRMCLLHNNARKRLRDVHDQHREMSEMMVNTCQLSDGNGSPAICVNQRVNSSIMERSPSWR